jgi:hypothetical protein
MKLTKLPSGAWIDPGQVDAIVPKHLDHLGHHCAVVARGQHHIVLFPTLEDAKRWADEFAGLVNGSEAPPSASSGSIEGYPIEHDCWVVYEDDVFEPNRDLGYFWTECEAWHAVFSDMGLAEGLPKELSKEVFVDIGRRVVKAKLLTQDPNEEPSS